MRFNELGKHEMALSVINDMCVVMESYRENAVKTKCYDLQKFKTLLRACRYHGNLSLGEDMANKGLALASYDPALYILLADLYDESGKLEFAQKITNSMSEKGLCKKLSKSTVEIQGKVRSFASEDATSTVEKTNGIYAEIEWIKSETERSGFAYKGSEKASYDSAKQAAVFGLVYTSP